MKARRCKLWASIIWGLCGILITVLGILSVVHRPVSIYMDNKMREEVALVEGKPGYSSWTDTTKLLMRVYLFDVQNPDGIMQGELPKLEERGPYIYNEFTNKQIVNIDEDLDEIQFNVIRTYYFNKKLSGNCTEKDQVTILNPAYLGTINKLAGLPKTFMEKYGNDIAKLLPNQSTIFLRGKVKDILFDGMKIKCDPVKYKELTLICATLKGKKPPIMRDTEREGVYAFSFFHSRNATINGPFTVNRGVKDYTRLGYITSVNGARKTKFWRNDTCNTIMGTDVITWPPMKERAPRVFTYIQSTCRSTFLDYTGDVILNGLTGWRYAMTEKLWQEDEMQCYCPLVKKEVQCLPKGLLDISECQEAPVIASEPHFLHGDTSLLGYAQGLHPNESRHQAYIVIEPMTGAPLEGKQRIQLNLQLSQQPVDLLTNVSEGYFPLLWLDTGGRAERILLVTTYQAYRLVNVLYFLEIVPLIVGPFIIFGTLLLCDTKRRRKKKQQATSSVDIVLVPSRINGRNIVRRSLPRVRSVFQ